MGKEELMARANELGLFPHHATGELKLAQLIEEKENEGAAFEAGSPGVEVEVKVEEELKVESKPAVKGRVMTRSERHSMIRKQQKRLVRIVLRSNDEAEKEWKGKTFKFSNILHTITRFIPFDNEEGWHVEQGLLNSIRGETCTRFVEETTRKGRKIKVAKNVKKYTIEMLDPLVQEDIEGLKADQSARGAID